MGYDYKKLGLKAGLEIHQQLNTGKLFCRCPSEIRESKPDYTFFRKMHPVPSEFGNYDPAALTIFKRNYRFKYESYHDLNCLIDIDEEPIQPVNPDALRTVLEVGLLCNIHLIDEVTVMRKAIIDGSVTSGFQRTMLIGFQGKIELPGKTIPVESLILEEDAGRTIAKDDEQKEITYRIDRLGIPLIELTTAPVLHTPEEVKECATKIGELMRITGNVMRGLGSIRQDVNVSIREGARIEIKGVQELMLMDEYVIREIQRQIALLAIRDELNKRKVTEKDLNEKIISLTEVLKNTTSPLVKSALQKKQVIFGVRLKGFEGLIGKEVQPGRRFGTELAGYVKVKTALKGILHSDELPGHGITPQEVNAIAKTLKVEKGDGFVFGLGEELEVVYALEVCLERCKEALKGVPKETRGAIGEGNTEFQRPLAGAARMYPETDVQTIPLMKEQVDGIRKQLPLWAEERAEKYVKQYGLNETLANKMKLDNNARYFESLVDQGMNAKHVAIVLLEEITELQRNGFAVQNIPREELTALFTALKQGTFLKDHTKDALKELSKGKAFEEILAGTETTGEKEIDDLIQGMLKKNSAMIKEKGMHALSALMGEAMKELKGRASGKEIAEALKKALQEKVN